jgi:ATP-binding cassette subfamily B protein
LSNQNNQDLSNQDLSNRDLENHKINFKEILKVFSYIKFFKKNIIAIIFFMSLIAIVDGIFPLFTKIFVDKFIINKTQIAELYKYFAMFLGISILQSVNVYIFILIAGYLKSNIRYNLRKEIFEKLQYLSHSFYDKNSVGWLMTRVNSDVEKMAEALSWGIVDITWGVAIIIFFMVMMLFLNAKLALYTFIIIPPLLILGIMFQIKILKYSRKARKINSEITSAFNEGIMGAKTTKTLGREKESFLEFEEITSRMKKASIKVAVLSSLFLPSVMMLSTIGTGITIYFGGNMVVNNTLTYGTLIAFISYTLRFFEPVSHLARVFAEYQSQFASMERVMGLLSIKNDIKDSGSIEIDNIKGDIRFENVSFSYIPDEMILEDFNLSINAGEKIALVGETGSGKSTLVNLICRFYEPTKGKIFIDNIDYQNIKLESLHNKIGYVLQHPYLFSGSIKENIAYGIKEFNDEIMEKIIKVAKLVNAHDFISKLKNGYDTEVGEGGSLLSIGEKQLISFARAIFSNPKIFILDEATSSIDGKTEKLIQSAIENILENRTSFIIAHRLSTIRNCDKIIVLKKGKIIEMGTHNELMNKKGYYFELYTKQFVEENENQLLNKSVL